MPLENASRLPSGDHAGYRSSVGLLLTRVTPDPSALAARVARFDLPNLLALKFVLDGALDGGAAASLRSDNLGKTIGAQLLRMEIEVDDARAEAALAGARDAALRF